MTAQYQVPQRFGAAGMLALMAVFSGIFGLLHRMGAPGSYYLFCGVLGMVVGVAQMRGHANPRRASILVGGLLLPPALILGVFLERGYAPIWLVFPMALLLAVFGAILGYLMGTLLAGAFLIADALDRWLDGPRTGGKAASG